MSRSHVRTALPPAKPVLTAEPPRQRRREPDPLPLRALKALASLRLTVVLFVLSILLVFFGTLAQVEAGIWTVVNHYFRWFYVWIPFQVFVPFGQVFLGFPKKMTLPGSFPFPGGWLLGTLLLVNLVAAHLVRFKISWKRSGILILHAGIIILMVGELVTGIFAVEGNMPLRTGHDTDYLVHPHFSELAFIDPSDPKTDDVVVVPAKMLQKGGLIRNDELPVDVQVERYMVNSRLLKDVPPPGTNPATAGAGLTRGVDDRPEASGTDPNQEVDAPSAYLTFKKKDTGESLGTYLVSFWLDTQDLKVDGKTYQVALRPKQTYKPFSVHLIEAKHDVFTGTDIPKNYSSLVRIEDPTRGEVRESLIRMNEPLYYAGETFYQYQMNMPDADSVLQVVHNPGVWMPYIACAMVALGMLTHFGITLVGFLQRTLAIQPHVADVSGAPLYVPLIAAGFVGVYLLLVGMAPEAGEGQMDVAEFGRIPVLNGGRVMPIDSVARNSLMVINGGYQTFKDSADREQPAVRWLLDVMVSNRIFRKDTAEKEKVFRIENDQVLNLLGLPRREGFRYAIDEFRDKIDKLDEKANQAAKTDPKQRDVFQAKVLELAQHLDLYMKLARYEEPLLVPPARADEDWQPLGPALLASEREKNRDSDAFAFSRVLLAYADGDAKTFNKEVKTYRERLETRQGVSAGKAGFEASFNHFAPFYQCMILYGLGVFLPACLSWVVFPRVLSRMAFAVAVVTLVVHTGALIARMVIQGRPPVTNLYSSAVFIGWGCVVVCLILELIFRRALYSIGNAVAGVAGFLTLFVAHNLGTEGDTMGMMQAVLDTNFWLATHVTCVTMGYTATLLAGILGWVLVIHGAATGWHDSPLSLTLNKVLYGILCFATLLSFTGTVLGGIWADYSWGRFWGWDPKENGALLIVIWNALVLHARWAGLVKLRGVAVLAVVGNMIVGWSWFGTNQLGVGLHAYGFNNKLAAGLTVFWAFNTVVMLFGLVPVRYWRGAGLSAAGARVAQRG
jgi:ABC-type transport system involved in cytochrome c biogenesis permease subunit